MSKQEFIEAHRHEIGGWLLDAATAGRTGAQLALSVRNMMKLIDSRLGTMYEQLVPAETAPLPAKPTPQVNGTHKAPEPTRR